MGVQLTNPLIYQYKTTDENKVKYVIEFNKR